MSLKPSESGDIENVCGQKYEEGHIKDRAARTYFLGDSSSSSSVKMSEPNRKRDTHGVHTSPDFNACMQSSEIMTQTSMLAF